MHKKKQMVFQFSIKVNRKQGKKNCLILFGHFISFPISSYLSSYSLVFLCLVLCYLVLSHLVLSFFCLVLSFFRYIVLSCMFLFGLFWFFLIWSCLISCLLLQIKMTWGNIQVNNCYMTNFKCWWFVISLNEFQSFDSGRIK